MPLAAVAMCVFGIVIQKALIDPITARSRTPAGFENATLIVFFGVLLILQNVALLLWTADYRVVSYLTEPVRLGRFSVAANRLVVLAVALGSFGADVRSDAVYDGRKGDPRRKPGPRHREADGDRHQADRVDRLRARFGRLPGSPGCWQARSM